MESASTDQLLTAYARLGVAHGASLEEIRARYLLLVKEHHPDLGGDPHQMAEITEAHELLVSERRMPGSELAVRPNPELIVHQAIERRRERREGAERVMRELVRHQTSPLAHAARQRRWLAVGSGGLAVLVALTRTLGLDRFDTSAERGDVIWLPGEIRLFAALVLAMLAASFGVLAWIASARATWIQSALEDADDALSDKNSFLALIEEISAEGDLADAWTQSELVETVSSWSNHFTDRHPWVYRHATVRLLGLRANHSPGVPLAVLASITGPVDFAKLVIAKGLESGLIAEHLTVADGKAAYRYSSAIAVE